MAVGLLATAALAVTVSGVPAGNEAPLLRMAATGVMTFRACNHTGDVVLVAGSFIPVSGSEWSNKGWTAVNPNGCRDIFTTSNRTFYARAEVKGNSSVYWGGDIKQCVEYPGPYNFQTRSEDTTCPEGQPADFTTFHSDGRPIYTWNLNP